MSEETPPEAVRLPIVAEIEAATELMSAPNAFAKVVRLNERFAVMMGHGVSLIETETWSFLPQIAEFQSPKSTQPSVTLQPIRLIISWNISLVVHFRNNYYPFTLSKICNMQVDQRHDCKVQYTGTRLLGDVETLALS